MTFIRLPDGSDDTPDEAGRHTKTVNVLHSAGQYARFPGCTDCRGIAQAEDPEYQARVAAATAHIHPELDQVDIRTDPEDGHLSVWTTWKGDGLDRTDGSGWAVKDRRMAERLAAAIRAGKVVTAEGVGIDIDGRTYVKTRSNILARTMNADLRRLGF